MAQVLGVGGIFFKSSSPRKLARWYSRSLGFALLGPTAAMFRAARLPKSSYTVWSVFSASSRYFKPSASRHMVNFVVDDVEGALTQVVAAGASSITALTGSTEEEQFLQGSAAGHGIFHGPDAGCQPILGECPNTDTSGLIPGPTPAPRDLL